MINWRLLIMMCIVAFISLSAGCAIFSGGSGDPAVDGTQSAVNTDPSDSNGSPFSAPADDTSVDDDSGDDTTVVDDDTDTTKDTDETEVDKVTIEGVEEASLTVDGSLNALFTASPADTGLSYTWQVEGKPDWIAATEDGSSNQKLTLTADTIPGAIVAQSFPMTIKAKEAGGKEASFAFTVSVAAVVLPMLNYEDPCKGSFRIELTDGTEAERLLELGTKDYTIKFRAMRGDKPAQDVEWKWSSVVKDSLHCIDIEDYIESSSMLDDRIKNDLAANDYEYHYNIEEGNSSDGNVDYKCIQETWTGQNVDIPHSVEDIPGVVTPIATTNETWQAPMILHVVGDNTPVGNTLTLTGDIVYKGPLPVRKYDHNGYDDVLKTPVEELTVTATDQCMRNAQAETNMLSVVVPYKVTINLAYPNEPVSNVKVRFKYKDLGIVNSWGHQFGIHLMDHFEHLERNDFEDASEADEWYAPRSLASSVYDLFDGFSRSEDGTQTTDWKKVKVNEDSTGDKKVGSVTDLILYVNIGSCVTSETWTSSETTCPDFDIYWIRWESNYWKAEYNDETDEQGDTFNDNFDFWDDFDWHISNTQDYPGMDKYSVKCSEGKCPKNTVFHRRDFPNYN